MTDFPTLFIILAGIFLIGLIPLALCALYAACQKRKWCAKLCLWDQRENATMTTSVELDDLTATMHQQPGSRPVSALLGDTSHRSSRCDASDTASDPGMDHINRFLGRSLSDEARNIYESDNDAGVLHIRRALGLMNKNDVDPGTAHVRIALGMIHEVRGAQGQNQNQGQSSVTGSQSAMGDLANNPPGTNNAPDPCDRSGGRHGHENIVVSADISDTSPTSETYSDGSEGVPRHETGTIDRLPSYEEALDILAKINEPEEPPPSYDDAVSNRNSRSTEV